MLSTIKLFSSSVVSLGSLNFTCEFKSELYNFIGKTNFTNHPKICLSRKNLKKLIIPVLNRCYAGENVKSDAVVFMKKLLWYIGNSVDSVTNKQHSKPRYKVFYKFVLLAVSFWIFAVLELKGIKVPK